ncbi:MAG: hypothetical protein MK085_08210 [Phycisphaerales bacterium]|nr:hypothetical protein [Phycisphaerales bacterium]
MRRYRPISLAIFFTATMAVSGLWGCEYNNQFQGDDTVADQDAGMNTFNEDTGGINQDPLIGGGQAGFDR